MKIPFCFRPHEFHAWACSETRGVKRVMLDLVATSEPFPQLTGVASIPSVQMKPCLSVSQRVWMKSSLQPIAWQWNCDSYRKLQDVSEWGACLAITLNMALLVQYLVARQGIQMLIHCCPWQRKWQKFFLCETLSYCFSIRLRAESQTGVGGQTGKDCLLTWADSEVRRSWGLNSQPFALKALH